MPIAGPAELSQSMASGRSSWGEEADNARVRGSIAGGKRVVAEVCKLPWELGSCQQFESMSGLNGNMLSQRQLWVNLIQNANASSQIR